MASLENRLLIAGRLVGASYTRYSPAGLPLTRFVLEHHSSQMEAAMPREANCRIAVLACGEALVRDVAHLVSGTLVRVSGFISRANHRQGAAQLVLHAERIDILGPPLEH